MCKIEQNKAFYDRSSYFIDLSGIVKHSKSDKKVFVKMSNLDSTLPFALHITNLMHMTYADKFSQGNN